MLDTRKRNKMQRSSNTWTRATKLALIQEYRNHPILWQRGYRVSRYTPGKTQAWCEIATKLRMPVRECQQKILSCKAMYRKIRGLVRKKQKGEVISRESWFGYKHLQFLDQNLESSEQNDSLHEELDSDCSQEGKVVESTDCQSAGVYVKQEAYDEEDLLSLGEPSIQGTDVLEDDTCQDQEADGVLEAVKMFSTIPNHTRTDALEHPKCPTHSMKVNDERHDIERPFDAFGRYVAVELSNMPPRAAILLQQQLHQCIIDAKLQTVGP
uniref:MADF domain-containing protein n=1 Tax=Anopheles funestus TaxID=62324 RepID=A0A182RBY2_ANOFN